MATLQIYLISNTAGDSSFAVQPQTFNGPGGVQQTTDLTLYGNGAPNWGQEFNENFYRLLENWAVGAKIELPGTNPVDQPLNANDIGGTDVGISHPVRGQTWFNTSSGYLFAYDGSVWQLTNIRKGNSAPSNPAVGALWFDTGNTRLKTWDGSAWVSHVKVDGDVMTGALTLNADPLNPLEAATKQYVDNTTVSVSGDTMTGLLTLSGDPTNPLEAATKQYVDNIQLNDVSDVNTTPNDGDLLAYNTSAGQWEQTPQTSFSMPSGVIFPYAGPSSQIPSGWLFCDGRQVSRTTYSALYNLIGTTYGLGDGSTTFNIPDFRGEFLRGLDEGRGVDAGRALGSNQSDQANSIRSHDSTSNTSAGSFADREVPDDGSYSEFSWTGRSDPVTKAIRMRKWGRETRPRNVAVNYIIKT